MSLIKILRTGSVMWALAFGCVFFLGLNSSTQMNLSNIISMIGVSGLIALACVLVSPFIETHGETSVQSI